MRRKINNILRGVGSLLVLWPPASAARMEPPSAGRTDLELISSDWKRVGLDLEEAMDWGERRARRNIQEEEAQKQVSARL